MNLFALTQNAARRIVRIPLLPALQAELEIILRTQEANFLGSIEQEFAFDGKYKPDDGECLFITDYDDIDNIHAAIANPLAIPEIDPSPVEFSSIKALFSGYATQAGSNVALIQVFDRRRILSPIQFAIFHTANTYSKVGDIGLSIDNRLAAILTDNRLQFFSFHNLRQIFDLSQYYTEATNTDLESFAQEPLLMVNSSAQLIQISDSWVRRKVSLIAQSNILTLVPIANIKASAALFNIDFETVQVNGNEKIVLPLTKPELKKLLRFLDEDYYQSSLQGHNRVTTSKRPA